MRRQRIKQTASLQERLAAFAAELRGQADNATGTARDDLLKRARQAETASVINEWAYSPGLRSPK